VSEFDQMIEQTIGQLRSLVEQPSGRDWYRVEAKAGTRTAQVWLYDDIGWLGTTAKSFADEVRALDVDDITVHVNSPGGGAWDGIAIHNTLRDHRARVTVVVDGMAASAASVVAMAGDTVRMNRGAQMMIHGARGVAAGPAAVMAEAAAMLDKLSDAMAGIYAARAGGTVEDWRTAMDAETWYSAAEAVDAGLADELVDDTADAPQARWDMAAYAYAHAGRAAAPAPPLPHRPPPISAAEAARRIHAATRTPNRTPIRTEEGAGRMDPAKIREALGLAADASDSQVTAALAAAGLTNQPDPPTPEPQPDPTPPGPAPAGVIQVSASVWDEQQKTIARLSAYVDESRRNERDQVLAKAMQEGKFTPAQKQDFERMWDADPDAARKVIAGLTPNTAVAVAAFGFDGDAADRVFEREFGGLFPAGFFGGKGA
jgi:ATP-dependent protease ClpP protease subunit